MAGMAAPGIARSRQWECGEDAILELRALRNSDFDERWRYYVDSYGTERTRFHTSIRQSCWPHNVPLRESHPMQMVPGQLAAWQRGYRGVVVGLPIDTLRL
jgi:hypothetical protein